MARFDDMIGADYEQAYAKVLHGKVIGGQRDGGCDVLIPEFGSVQVKGSAQNALRHLANSMRFGKFIPLCIGEPGTREEIIQSLKDCGAWVGREVSNRSNVIKAVNAVRAMLL